MRSVCVCVCVCVCELCDPECVLDSPVCKFYFTATFGQIFVNHNQIVFKFDSDCECVPRIQLNLNSCTFHLFFVSSTQVTDMSALSFLGNCNEPINLELEICH